MNAPSLLDLPEIVIRHRSKVLLFFASTVIAVAVFTYLSSRKYVSEAQVFVRMGRESIGLDPTATTGSTAAVYESRESEITTVLDMFRSRGLAEKVVDVMGAKLTNKDLKNALDRENVITDLDEAVEVLRNRNSNVIAIRATAKSPELAQEIVAEYLKALKAQHVLANSTEGSYEFFESQTKLLKGQLQTAIASLRDAKNEAGINTIEGRRTVLQEQVRTVEADLLTTQAALAASAATLEALRNTLTQLPEKLTLDGTGFPNTATEDVRRQLHTLQIREQELASRFSDDYPLLKTVREQAKEAELILGQQEAVSTSSANPANPARQQLYMKLLDEEAQHASLRAKEIRLKEQQAQVASELKELNGLEGNLELLQQNVDVLTVSHRTYVDKLEQARIDRALEDERISNVNVFQAPTYVAKPVSPRVKLNLALGILLGAFGGVGLAFMSETYRFSRWTRTSTRYEPKTPAAALVSVQ